jgi:hypothetical protein
VTNLGTSSRAVVRFYNKRGTAEQSIKEGKRCESDRLQPRRRLALPTQVATLSLTSLQQRLVKTGGRLIRHARYYWFLLLTESHLARRLFGSMLRGIATLPSPAG